LRRGGGALTVEGAGIGLGLPVLGHLGVLLHARVIFSHLVILLSFKFFNNKLVKDF